MGWFFELAIGEFHKQLSLKLKFNSPLPWYGALRDYELEHGSRELDEGAGF